jgi:hypothetical protein
LRYYKGIGYREVDEYLKNIGDSISRQIEDWQLAAFKNN